MKQHTTHHLPFPRRLEQTGRRSFRREQAAQWFAFERSSGLRL